MNNKHIIAILCFALGLISCHQEAHEGDKHVDNHWAYQGKSGPNNWDHICKEYSMCGGKKQSPINIVTKVALNDSHLKPLQLKYNTTKVHIINNGHTVQFNCDEGSKIVTPTKEYTLKQFHFHTPSEHEVNGEHRPMEAHFVHQANDGTLAVMGVFFKYGEQNSFLADHLEETPHKEGKYDAKYSMDLHELLPHEASYFHYDGSLTTPPCSEIVSWYVMDEALEFSKEQFTEMHGIMHDNYRPVQPLNGRKLEHFAAN